MNAPIFSSQPIIDLSYPAFFTPEKGEEIPCSVIYQGFRDDQCLVLYADHKEQTFYRARVTNETNEEPVFHFSHVDKIAA